LLHHPDRDPVGVSGMPMIVEAENGDVVLADEVQFVFEGRVVFVLWCFLHVEK
jgi:hypothetical protein